MTTSRRSRALLTALAMALSVSVSAPLLSTPAQAASSSPILFGLMEHSNAKRLHTQHQLHKSAALVGFFFDWNDGLPSKTYLDEWTTSRGAVPVIATGPGGSAPLARVINGSEDARIKSWADATKAYNHPIMFRLMAEMNGPWEPWSTGVNGNKAGQYVTAWRHIVDLFRARGATNAVWVWNPDRSFKKATPMASLYPGSGYVDWIGLDVYNFNTAAKGGWRGWNSLMAPSVKEIRAATGSSAKPLMLGEVGCAQGHKKAKWIKHMYASLPHYGVKAVLYFDYKRDRDWRLTHKKKVRKAARKAVKGSGITGANEMSLTTVEGLVTG
jgi:Glycosyl hydrolase family 26